MCFFPMSAEKLKSVALLEQFLAPQPLPLFRNQDKAVLPVEVDGLVLQIDRPENDGQIPLLPGKVQGSIDQSSPQSQALQTLVDQEPVYPIKTLTVF
jgi:hypothetical protein